MKVVEDYEQKTWILHSYTFEDLDIGEVFRMNFKRTVVQDRCTSISNVAVTCIKADETKCIVFDLNDNGTELHSVDLDTPVVKLNAELVVHGEKE